MQFKQLKLEEQQLLPKKDQSFLRSKFTVSYFFKGVFTSHSPQISIKYQS